MNSEVQNQLETGPSQEEAFPGMEIIACWSGQGFSGSSEPTPPFILQMRILRPRGVGKGTCGYGCTVSPQVKESQISTRALALALAPHLFYSLSFPVSLFGWVRNPNIYGLFFAEEQNSCLFHQRRHAPGQVHSKSGGWSIHKALLCL